MFNSYSNYLFQDLRLRERIGPYEFRVPAPWAGRVHVAPAYAKLDVSCNVCPVGFTSTLS